MSNINTNIVARPLAETGYCQVFGMPEGEVPTLVRAPRYVGHCKIRVDLTQLGETFGPMARTHGGHGVAAVDAELLAQELGVVRKRDAFAAIAD